jgi:hypothetical protein
MSRVIVRLRYLLNYLSEQEARLECGRVVLGRSLVVVNVIFTLSNRMENNDT